MRDIGEGTIRRIDWHELVPVVRLFRIFNTATSLWVIFLAMIGVLLSIAAGLILNKVLPDSPARSVPAVIEQEIGPDGELLPPRVRSSSYHSGPKTLQSLRLNDSPERTVAFRNDPVKSTWRYAERSILTPWYFFSSAGMEFFSLESRTWAQRGGDLLWLVVLLVIWSFFGGMICRTVALRLTVDESESTGNLWRFLLLRGTGFLSSMLLVAIGILLCLGAIRLAGWLYTAPVVNFVVAALFPVVMFVGFIAILLALGLLLGWPLLFAAVAVDGSDGFDAVSRMFSYVYQRLLHYLFYWTVSGILGILGFVFVSLFVDGIVQVSVHFGRFPQAIALTSFGDLSVPETFEKLSASDRLILAWCSMAQLIKPAFVFAWFWTSGVAIYLLLRRSVDAAPFDDVFRIGPGAETQALPEIRRDEKGAPEMVRKTTNSTSNSDTPETPPVS